MQTAHNTRNRASSGGSTSGQIARATVRVRYFETDQMHVAHHAHYFVWFEAARSEFCRKYGIDYRQMEAEGWYLPIIEARCRYRSAARYDDEITVEASVPGPPERTLRFQYTVRRGEEEIAVGETVQMLVNCEGRARSFPKDLAARFGLS